MRTSYSTIFPITILTEDTLVFDDIIVFLSIGFEQEININIKNSNINFFMKLNLSYIICCFLLSFLFQINSMEVQNSL